MVERVFAENSANRSHRAFTKACRVKENASMGTDHGTAGPVLLAGPSVAAGLHGSMPSLLDLENDDLRYTVDFRQVYTTVAQQWLGIPGSRVVGGEFEKLPLLRS